MHIKFMKIADYIYEDIIAGKHGYLNQEELTKILNDCKKKDIPFWFTDADGLNLERIV